MTGGSFALTEAERLRVEHIDELVARGAPAVDELIAALSEQSWTVRRSVIGGLAALGDEAVGPLCAWLRTHRSEEHAIAAAVDALSASVGSETNRHVMELATDANPAVVADAAAILGRRHAHDAIGLLERLLSHPDDNVAVAATEAIGAIGGAAAIDTLIGVLQRREFFRTFPAIQVLGRSADPRAVAPLASLLSDDTFRIEAARALGRTGSAQAIVPITSLLAHGGDAMTRLVASSLADLITRAHWIGSAMPVEATLRAVATPALSRFIQSLHGADDSERAAIAVVLGKIGDASTVSALARMLEEPALARSASAAIQDIGRDHEDALTEALGSGETATRIAILPIVGARRSARRVRALLADEDPEVRARACEALARIGDSSVVPTLFGMLGDTNPRVSHAAAGAIQSLGAVETPALVVQNLSTSSPTVRRQVLRIAGYLGCNEAFDNIYAATADPDLRTAEIAVGALAALEDPRTDTAISALARSPEPTLRAAAQRAATTRPSPAMLALIEYGITDSAPWVRYYACRGLGQLGYPATIHLLVQRLSDDVPHIRIAAIEALSRFDTDQAWQALSAAAHAKDADERRAALLGISRHRRPEATEILLAAADDPDAATQLIALSGLAITPDPRALAQLSVATRSTNLSIRDAALSLLAERTDVDAAKTLLDLAIVAPLEHPVHLALSRPHAMRIATIASRLNTANENEAAVFVPALARMGDPAATTALFETLLAASSPARRTAAIALVAIAANGARGAVARMAVEDPDPDVRRACAAAVS